MSSSHLQGKGQLRFLIGIYFHPVIKFCRGAIVPSKSDIIPLRHLWCRQNPETRDPNPFGHFAATHSILSSAVSLAFVYSLLTTSPHSLSLYAHAPCPLHPLSTTLLLLCVPFTLCLDSGVCVHARVCVFVRAQLRESSEDRGEPRACLVGTRDRSRWGAPAQKQQWCGFRWYLILCNCPLWQFSEWGRVVVGEGGAISEAENRSLELNTYFPHGEDGIYAYELQGYLCNWTECCFFFYIIYLFTCLFFGKGERGFEQTSPIHGTVVGR